MRRAFRSAGFTLVEVLVALVIMAVMAMVAWRGLDALLTSRNISQEHLDQSVRVQAVLEQWELDLRALQDTTVLPPLAFDGATMKITRQQPTGMQVVVWSVRSGRLYRWEGPVVQTVAALEESYQRGTQLQAQDSVQLRALEGVSGWQMYYYRGNSWSNAQSTGNVVTSAASAASGPGGLPTVTNATALPDGVRMLLQFDPSSGFGGSLTRETRLGSQS